jgi:murein L,D-transpeptidase YcbB/YkuD
MRGGDVEKLLIILLRQNLLRADKIPNESIYNEDVEASIKRFQTSKGLKPDGRLDFRTLLLLRAQ